MIPSIIQAESYNDRSLIEAIIGNFFIIDYGFINKVNPDKTVNVTHAKKLKARTGDVLPETNTKNLEVLTIAGKGFSLNFEYEKGDKVLLLGLKNYVEKVDDVTNATEATCYLHYTRETMKALPLCVFDDSAKVKIEVAKGAMKVSTQDKIELNGNDKQFVTWAELNNALSQFTQQLSVALTAATYINSAGTPTVLAWPGGTVPASIDISAAKTKSVVTGG